MKPRRSFSMIILDAVLTLWWIIFAVLFFTVLIETNRPTISGFRAKGLVVIFNLLISEGECCLRSEWKAGRFWSSILLLVPTALAVWATHLYFDFFDYVDRYRWACVKLNLLTYFICLYINVSPSINEYLKGYKRQHWLEPWRNRYSHYGESSDEQN